MSITKRRSKQNSAYWDRRMAKLFIAHPEAKLVKNIYKSNYWLLMEKYKTILESEKMPIMYEFLKDCAYLDRKLRQRREGTEVELKKVLSQEAQIDLGYTPGNLQDSKILENL